MEGRKIGNDKGWWFCTSPTDLDSNPISRIIVCTNNNGKRQIGISQLSIFHVKFPGAGNDKNS
jgi:hypothetical protein